MAADGAGRGARRVKQNQRRRLGRLPSGGVGLDGLGRKLQAI
jgi:hypothetical protein